MSFLLILYRLYIFIEIITSAQCHKTHKIQALFDEYNMLYFKSDYMQNNQFFSSYVDQFIDKLWRMT